MLQHLKPMLLWGIAFAILLPWLIVQSQAMLNGNVSWLLIAAERMVNGESALQSIYESNPPLSIIIYIPHILFSRLLYLDIPTAAMILSALFIIISLTATSKILKFFSCLNVNEQRALLFGATSSITVITSIYFMDREHFMMMALIPFILCQYALTYKIPLPRSLLWPVLALGSIMLLVKPHYGVLPVAFFCHRMIVQRKLLIFKDPDFIALLTATIAYVLALITFYQDFLTVILPDIIDYYLPMHDRALTLRLFKPHFSAYIAFLCLECFMEDLEKPKRRLVIYLYVSALLSLIPLLLQNKGFYNHLMPAFGFFIMGFSLTLTFRIEKLLKSWPTVLTSLLPALILGLSILVIRPSWNYPKGREIRNMSLAQYLDKNCTQPCSFFVFHSDIEIINPTALYKNYTHASRFPSYWFIPTLLRKINESEKADARAKEKIALEKNKFALFAAQDLKKYKPSILLIGTNIDVFGNGKFLDYVNFFSVNEEFRKAFQEDYTKTGTFEFDRADYFRGTSMAQSYILKYDVYTRKTK